MTCKNCFNKELCEYYLKPALLYTGRTLEEIQDAEKCEFFKDRSKFIPQVEHIGKMLFVVNKQCISEYKIVALHIHNDLSISFRVITVLGGVYECFPKEQIPECEIGKTAFFTKCEAECALQEKNNGLQ